MVFTKSNFVVLLATTGVTLARSVRRHELNKRQGYIPDCTYTIEAISGDTCQTLADFATITVEQFKAYNPQVSDCNALNLGTEYCLEKNYGQPDPVTSSSASPSNTISTTVTVKPSSTSPPVQPSTVAPTSTKPAGTPAPAPTQEGVASNCNRWDVVQAGDSCGVYIAKYPGLTLADLVKFNPAIGSQCTNLWVEYALCTSVEGWKPSTTITTTTKPTATTIPGAVPAPGPTQAGVAANCNRWDVVKSGNTCDTFTQKYSGVTLANLVSWNPAIGSQCTNLWLDYYICTGVVGFTAPTKTTTTTAKPTATSTVPSPVQAGINASCKKYHLVVSGDGCYDLATKYRITLNNFYSWNPAVKNDCSSLWAGYYVCVGL